MGRNSSTQMFPLIQSYCEGKQSRSEICEHQNINKATFYYWHRKYHESHSTSESNFIDLEYPDSGSDYNIEVEFTNNIKIRFRSLPPINYITALVER